LLRDAGQLYGPDQQQQQQPIDVAVKILKDDDWRQPISSSIEDFKREVKIVSSFDHDNILRLIAIVPVGTNTPTPPYPQFASSLQNSFLICSRSTKLTDDEHSNA
jgi:serine/threonine protein kinase